jgi:hypothetical protein
VRTKTLLTVILAAAVILGAGLAVYRWQAARAPAVCQICGRDIPGQTAYRLETAGGSIRACCPACAMHFMLHHSGEVRESWATDFNSHRLIPASRAYFDEGGDVQYCTAHMAPVERGPEGVSSRVYDRCLPVLVAFATREEAEAYSARHGGRVLNYDQALESIRKQ